MISGSQTKTAAEPLHKRIVRPVGTMSSFITLLQRLPGDQQHLALRYPMRESKRGKRPWPPYCETAVPDVWNTTRVGGAIWLITGSDGVCRKRLRGRTWMIWKKSSGGTFRTLISAS